jgi:hypothetical protein
MRGVEGGAGSGLKVLSDPVIELAKFNERGHTGNF